MGRNLKELADSLKDYVIDQQSDAHNKGNLRKERYNNLKLVMDISKKASPHVTISIGMSEAEFDIRTGDKRTGGLGPDEKYVFRWLGRADTLPDLNDCWNAMARENGRG